MIEKRLNPKAVVLDVSNDPFVPRLVSLNRKTTIASKLQGWLEEDWIYIGPRYNYTVSPSAIPTNIRYLVPNHFTEVISENNHCHVPPNLYKPSIVGFEIKWFAVTELINWIVETYGLTCVDWSPYNDSRNNKLVGNIKMVIDIYAGSKLDFHSEGIQEVEDKILKIIMDYIDLLPPKEVVTIDLDPTRWERFKAWFGL